MTGVKRYQVALLKLEIDGGLLIEGLEAPFYYKLLRVEYFQNLWELEGNRMTLWGHFKHLCRTLWEED